MFQSEDEHYFMSVEFVINKNGISVASIYSDAFLKESETRLNNSINYKVIIFPS